MEATDTQAAKNGGATGTTAHLMPLQAGTLEDGASTTHPTPLQDPNGINLKQHLPAETPTLLIWLQNLCWQKTIP